MSVVRSRLGSGNGGFKGSGGGPSRGSQPSLLSQGPSWRTGRVGCHFDNSATEQVRGSFGGLPKCFFEVANAGFYRKKRVFLRWLLKNRAEFQFHVVTGTGFATLVTASWDVTKWTSRVKVISGLAQRQAEGRFQFRTRPEHRSRSED